MHDPVDRRAPESPAVPPNLECYDTRSSQRHMSVIVGNLFRAGMLAWLIREHMCKESRSTR